MRWTVAAFAGVAVVCLPLLAAPPAAAAEDADAFGLQEVDPDLPAKIKASNADCLSCHSREGVEHPPRPGMDLGLLARLVMDRERFEHGDHGKMACKECHTEAYVPYPHLPKAKAQIKTCEGCHQQPARTIVPEVKASAHFRANCAPEGSAIRDQARAAPEPAGAGGAGVISEHLERSAKCSQQHGDKFTCLSCHDAHAMRKADKLESPARAAAQDNAVCLSCHDDDRRYAALKPDARRPDMAGVHDWLPELPLHLSAIRCVDCHSPASEGGLSHEIWGRRKAERRCEACHAADTALGRRLYRKTLRDGPGEWGGFANAGLLKEVYVVGANGNRWLDLAGGLAVALTLLTCLGGMLWRRRRPRT